MAENRDTLRSARVAAEHRTPEAPADPLAAVARAPDGTYEPKGPQLAQLRYYLVGKSVRVAGIIESLSPVGDGKGETGVVTSDRAAHLMFAWDACPDELRDDFKWRSINDTAFKKGSVVSMVGTVTRIDGDLVIVKPSSVRRTAP